MVGSLGSASLHSGQCVIMKHEILNLINEQDELIGKVERDKAHAEGLWHRRATVFVFNSKNELLIQKRSSNMSWPNTWCGSASGHVLFNESYEEAAKRELKEEIGIDAEIKYIGKITEQSKAPAGEIENEHHHLFTCNSDGPFDIQQEELSEVKFESIKDIQKRIQKDPDEFTPGFRMEFEYFLHLNT